jgi:predicted metal-dependent enzyme (double-stranded beta helix superfamily)
MLPMTTSAFDLDRFVSDCLEALNCDPPQKAVREVLMRALANGGVSETMGKLKRAEVQKIHHGPELTILNIIWPPGFTFMPHDHRMWGLIGIYSGREDNVFWRRIEDEKGSRIEAAGAHAMMEGDCWLLGADIIHSVTNPIPRFTGAIQIYGGDFFNVLRSQWNPETLREERYDFEHGIGLFEEANRRWGVTGAK